MTLSKWISTNKANGTTRTFKAVNIMAVCAAISEGIPYTSLDAIGIKGKTITHNM